MSTWNQFLDEVRIAIKDLGNPSEVWYRGHTDVAWNLTPSLPRIADWERKEKLLFNEFNKISPRFLETRSNDWEILFDMQHYGIPTRLLDWTTVMGVAIAFALYGDYTDSSDSALFILDPLKLNYLNGNTEIVNIPDDKKFDYKTMYWANGPVRIERPIAIAPSRQISERLRAQNGTFTVFGTYGITFESSAIDCYRKVVLPATAKAGAREFLGWANLNEYIIYPDIVGMANHIKHKIL